MRAFRFVFISILVLFILHQISISVRADVIRKSELPKSKPVWNGKDGLYPDLLMDYSTIEELYKGELPDEFFKSSKLYRASECWWSGVRPKNAQASWVGRIITIRRWYFEYPEDACNFATLPGKVTGSSKFPEWDKKAEFGDKSVWLGSQRIIFVTGSVLVDIDVNSRGIGREYVRKIARFVENRLKEQKNKIPQPEEK